MLLLWIFARLFFDCTADDLLVAKLHAYDLSEDAVKFVYSYLKRRKQGVKVNDTESFFQIILTGIPEGSVLGPIIFSMFINDLLLFIKDVELADFANDFANFTVRNSIEELIKVLEKESKSAIGWSKMNMIVNTDMFQVMIMSCDKKRQT